MKEIIANTKLNPIAKTFKLKQNEEIEIWWLKVQKEWIEKNKDLLD
jgi:hypothetical protein